MSIDKVKENIEQIIKSRYFGEEVSFPEVDADDGFIFVDMGDRILRLEIKYDEIPYRVRSIVYLCDDVPEGYPELGELLNSLV